MPFGTSGKGTQKTGICSALPVLITFYKAIKQVGLNGGGSLKY